MARCSFLAVLLLLAALISPAAGIAADDEGRYVAEFHRFSDARSAVSQAGGRTVLELPNHRAVAALLSGSARSKLRDDGRVVSLEADPERFTLAQTVPYGIPMVQADLLASPNPGAVKVCVIDSGFYVGHEDLPTSGVTGAPNGGAGDWFNDGSGHGTHVAGTIAAVDNAAGVIGAAPGVSLHIVRVFGNFGEWAYASTLVAAVDECRAADADVVNMSLGGGGRSAVERKAFDAADKAGTLLIAAAGNAGDRTTSYPAGYRSVVSVASIDSNQVVASSSQQNRDVELAAPGVSVLSTVPWHDASSVTAGGITYDGQRLEGAPQTAGVTGDLVDGGLCDVAGAWSGKVVLCERGSIGFAEKVANVVAGGGAAVVIYNNVSGGFSGTLGSYSSSIPAISISQEDGTALKAGQLGQPATVVSQLTKPASGYESWSGTSMATPHVSGVAALVWSFNPWWTNDQVRDALTATALDLGETGRDPAYGFGLVQAKAARCNLQPSVSC